MKSNFYRVALAMLCAGGLLANGHAALKSAVISDFEGTVTLSKGGAASQPAKINSPVTSADVVQTGTKSLAELEFNDKTLTRLGANTVFSFSPKNREFEVQSGTALMQVPPGLGGAKIQTGAVTAAITGTTVMIQKLPSGVVKLMVLEGSMNATLKGSNQMQTIKAGQMLIIPPNVNNLPHPIVINVATIVGTSKLVKGFKTELVSLDKIDQTMEKQKELAEDGGLKTSGIIITTTEDLLRLIGNNVLSSATFDSLTQALEYDGEGGGQIINGPVVIGGGANLTPTAGGTLGQLMLNNGLVVSAFDIGGPDDTYFVLGGPLTFQGTLPEIDANSPGLLGIIVVGTDFGVADPAITFLNIANATGPYEFASVFFEAEHGAIVFNNADITVDNSTFNASTGNMEIINSDLAVGNGSTQFLAGNDLNVDNSNLTVNNGSAQLHGANTVNIDNSSIDLFGTTGENLLVQSGGNITINDSTIGGGSGNHAVSLTSINGNINVTGSSVIGGAGVTSIIAQTNGDISIIGATVIGNTVTMTANNLTVTGTTFQNATTINFNWHTSQNITGNTYNGATVNINQF